jgi:hypothetical protein
MNPENAEKVNGFRRFIIRITLALRAMGVDL